MEDTESKIALQVRLFILVIISYINIKDEYNSFK